MPVDPIVFWPDSDEYRHATSPHNWSGSQRPILVARASTAAEVVQAVHEARRRGLARLRSVVAPVDGVLCRSRFLA